MGRGQNLIFVLLDAFRKRQGELERSILTSDAMHSCVTITESTNLVVSVGTMVADEMRDDARDKQRGRSALSSVSAQQQLLLRTHVMIPRKITRRIPGTYPRVFMVLGRLSTPKLKEREERRGRTVVSLEELELAPIYGLTHPICDFIMRTKAAGQETPL